MDKAKAMRKLGALAVGQLQAKKASDVEVIASEGTDKDLLGVFSNSFVLSNYEWSKKTAPEVEEKKEEDVDERTKRHSKKIDSFELSHEEMD